MIYIILIYFQRAGAVFPQRAERSAPYFNPQVLPAGTYPASSRSPDFQREEAESAGTEPPALTYLSLSPSLSHSLIHNQSLSY